MQTLKISEVLRLAANEFLAETQDEYDAGLKNKYSCIAISAADSRPWPGNAREWYTTEFGMLNDFGVQIANFPFPIQQQIRFATLHFAADYAEELGL